MHLGAEGNRMSGERNVAYHQYRVEQEASLYDCRTSRSSGPARSIPILALHCNSFPAIGLRGTLSVCLPLGHTVVAHHINEGNNGMDMGSLLW